MSFDFSLIFFELFFELYNNVFLPKLDIDFGTFFNSAILFFAFIDRTLDFDLLGFSEFKVFCCISVSNSILEAFWPENNFEDGVKALTLT